MTTRLLLLTPLLLLPLAGCTSDQERADIATAAGASYNADKAAETEQDAAKHLKDLQDAEALQQSIAAAVGHPLSITSTGAAVTP